MKLKSTLALAFAMTLCAGVSHSAWADDDSAAQGMHSGGDQQKQGQAKDDGRSTASVHNKVPVSPSDDAGNADSDLAKADQDVQHHDASLQPSNRGTNFH